MKKDLSFINKHRLRRGAYGSDESYGCNGAFGFHIPGEARLVCCIASDGKEWRPISGYEGLYEVSNYGEIKALTKDVEMPNNGVRHQQEKILSPELIEKGYQRVLLCKPGSQTAKLIHCLVAEAFIPNPKGFPEVNHVNGNKCCNVVTNLEWCSQEYNQHHAIEAGLRSGWAADQIEAIKQMFSAGMSSPEIAEKMKASRQSISGVVFGRHRNLTPEQPTRYEGLPLWEHISVSFGNKSPKTPSWEVMCAIKDIFWEPEEVVVQLHPAKSDYVNNHPGVLHLWRCTDGREQPMPPAIMVGMKELNVA